VRTGTLAAILRVADALDRAHLQHVQSVEASLEDGIVNLEVEGVGDLLLERWALAGKKTLFEKVFRRTIVVSH
jgi:exopolyphosphatase / guanosine-5'-triphosphate,3'-diphosphate pyrophosphatase